MQYPIAIYQQNNAYHVTVPDIESISVIDSSMAGAVSNTRMAVMSHLYHLIEEDLPIPEPSSVTEHLIKPKYAGYTWAIVSVELSRIMGKTVEVTLQLPSQLISQAIEQFADESLDKIVLMALKSYVKNQSNG